jgi:hypothetical protein
MLVSYSPHYIGKPRISTQRIDYRFNETSLHQQLPRYDASFTGSACILSVPGAVATGSLRPYD